MNIYINTIHFIYLIRWLYFIQRLFIKYGNFKTFSVLIQFMFCIYFSIIGIILHVGRNLINNA